MPGGPVLGVVDGLAREERVAPFGEAALLGEAGEQAQRHAAEALARVVEAQARRGSGELRDSLRGLLRIGAEQFAQRDGAPALGVVGEIRPGLAGGRRGRVHFWR